VAILKHAPYFISIGLLPQENKSGARLSGYFFNFLGPVADKR
jgi:hypothetical protein